MKTKLKNAKGFTIIEVLIVLAVAGLILLIVFLAVPALQRNSANNNANVEGARILAATNEFISNKNGTVPASTDATEIKELAKATNTPVIAPTTATGATPALDEDVSGASGTASATNVRLYTGAKCSTVATTPTTFSVNKGTARQVALMYGIENSTGGYSWKCQDS